MPEEITKSEFIAEVNKRGTIAISEIPITGNAKDRWICADGYVTYLVSEPNITVTIFFESTGGIKWGFLSIGAMDVDSIPMNYALETINKLPFVTGQPSVKSYINCTSEPTGAEIWLKRH